MAQLLLIRGAKQLLTLRGPSGLRRGAALHDLAIIEDGSVLIQDGMIESVGSTRRVENLKAARGALEIAVNGAIVMPGFVDPAIDIGSVAERSSPKRTRAEDFREQSISLLRACLQHGTLSAQLAVAATNGGLYSEIGLLRNLVQMGGHPIGIHRAWKVSESSGLAASPSLDPSAAIALLTKRNLAQGIAIDPAFGESVDEAVWQTASENRICTTLLWPGGSAETLLRTLNWVRARAVSCHWDVSDSECAVLSQMKMPVILAPAASITQDTAGGSIRTLAASDAALVLSSGYNAREMPVFNMQMTIALAVLRLGLTPEQAIVAATINAAHALGLAHSVGSVEVGKRADLLVLNLPDYREIPRRFGMNHVGMVIREGRVVFNRTGWKASAA